MGFGGGIFPGAEKNFSGNFPFSPAEAGQFRGLSSTGAATGAHFAPCSSPSQVPSGTYRIAAQSIDPLPATSSSGKGWFILGERIPTPCYARLGMTYFSLRKAASFLRKASTILSLRGPLGPWQSASPCYAKHAFTAAGKNRAVPRRRKDTCPGASRISSGASPLNDHLSA